MKNKPRILIVFIIAFALSFIPIAIGLTILDLYLSGHGIARINVDEVWPGMDWSNFLFIMLTLLSGIFGTAIYWVITSSINTNKKEKLE